MLMVEFFGEQGPQDEKTSTVFLLIPILVREKSL